jgi:uncharacterized Zn finger protein
MPQPEIGQSPPPRPPLLSSCPQCSAGLVVMSIITGRASRGGCEYWTMRCTRCGGIHLDIVDATATAEAVVGELIA